MRLQSVVFIAVIGLLVLASLSGAETCSSPLLVVEPDGVVSAGSKERLRSAVQLGFPLRVGFSIDFDNDKKPEVTHWADAAFITEFENEVFTQFSEIRRQTPKKGEAHIELSPTPQRWTGSVGSDGLLEGAFDDNQKPIRLRVRSIWCIDPRVSADRLSDSIK